MAVLEFEETWPGANGDAWPSSRWEYIEESPSSELLDRLEVVMSRLLKVRVGRLPGLPAFAGPRIILDTDISGDCDDVGAVAVLHALADLGECQIVATGVSSGCIYSPGALDAVNIWHGRPTIPTGTWKGTSETAAVDTCGQSAADFAQPIYTNYPRNVGLASTVPDAVAVYRQALHDAADGTITIVTIGFLNNLSALIDSPADGIDARNGTDLIAAKVAEVFVMGGRSGATTEYNVRESPVASANVADNCPVQITWNPWEVGGNVVTGTTNFDLTTHIVRYAYDIYDNVSFTTTANGHESWDLVTVLQAVRGDGPWFTTQRGTMTINPSTGADTFTADVAGRDLYTSLVSGQASAVAATIEPLMWTSEAN